MAHLQAASQHLHAIQPLVSLHSFSPAAPRVREQTLGRRAKRAANVVVAGRMSDGNANQEIMRDIARMMPDPRGDDDLLASDPPYGGAAAGGWGFPAGPPSTADPRMQDAYNDLLAGSDLFGNNTGGYEREASHLDDDDDELYARLEHLPPDQRLKELERITEKRAKEEWDLEQAQEMAMELHHSQIESSGSRYKSALRMAKVMEDLERHDYYDQDGQDLVPSWIRAYFQVEQEMALERVGKDPATLQAAIVAAKKQERQRRGGSGQARPLREILPGAQTSGTTADIMEELIGPEPVDEAPKFRPGEYNEYDDEGGDESDPSMNIVTRNDAPEGMSLEEQEILDQIAAEDAEAAKARKAAAAAILSKGGGDAPAAGPLEPGV